MSKQEIKQLIEDKTEHIANIRLAVDGFDWKKVQELAGELREVNAKLIVYGLLQRIQGAE